MNICLHLVFLMAVSCTSCGLLYRLDCISAGKNFNRIRRAITSGFFFHASRKDPTEGYKSLVENQPMYIHPSSALFQRQPDWVIYHELILTTKEYMREVCVIEPKVWRYEFKMEPFSSAYVNSVVCVRCRIFVIQDSLPDLIFLKTCQLKQSM